MLEISKPEPPKNVERWSDLERLNRERDLIGIYISGHPLDAYKIIVNDVCNLPVTQLEDLTPFANRDVMIGGIVTDMRTGQSRTGKPYGIVKMEDYTGAGEIALFGDDWARFSGYFQNGNSLFITARVEPKRWKESEFELKIGRVEFLTDVKDQKVKTITISLYTDKLTQNIVTEMSTIMKDAPGPTEVLFNVHDTEKQMQVIVQSKNTRISVDGTLIDFLKRNSMAYTLN